MLKKALRLRTKADFDRVFKYGTPFFLDEIACRCFTEASPGFRLGFSLGAKYLPRAVDRNRLRRLISALIEGESQLWPPHGDMVFSLRRPLNMSTLPSTEALKQAIIDILTRLQSPQNRK